MNPTHAVRIIVRTTKADSAFLYHVIEAHEGLATCTTLPNPEHAQYRDVELLVPRELVAEMKLVLEDLSDIVTILSQSV